jgi:hypothetical protein
VARLENLSDSVFSVLLGLGAAPPIRPQVHHLLARVAEHLAGALAEEEDLAVDAVHDHRVGQCINDALKDQSTLLGWEVVQKVEGAARRLRGASVFRKKRVV